MKKVLSNNFTVTSNMKRLPILGWYDLTEKEASTLLSDNGITDPTEDMESNYYFRVYGCLYSFESFQDASCPIFEEYIEKKYPEKILEDKMIFYICYGIDVVGAIVIDFYDGENYIIYSFHNN